ncbi:MAG TPA: malonic semialdehyde reductase [Steroidobacteraceae bacterium]|nr:malonic semialdehyde reductase [Steroidobacteraceae bacterium]
MTIDAVATALDDASLDRIFRAGRSIHTFKDRPVTDETLRALYELVKWGPTAFNAQPGRYVFVRSAAAKARLVETLSSGNKAKTLAAPVTCLVAYDTRFYDHLPAGGSAAGLLSNNRPLAEATAFRNSSLQGAYLLLAARALGLAAGPMSGFDPARLNAEFFAGSTWSVNFLINLGYPDGSEPSPRASRLPFEQCVQVI